MMLLALAAAAVVASVLGAGLAVVLFDAGGAAPPWAGSALDTLATFLPRISAVASTLLLVVAAVSGGRRRTLTLAILVGTTVTGVAALFWFVRLALADETGMGVLALVAVPSIVLEAAPLALGCSVLGAVVWAVAKNRQADPAAQGGSSSPRRTSAST